MENRQVIEWDKDDIDALKFMKVDVLGLGMLGCMRRAFDLLDKAKGMRLDLATIPAEDPATYAIQRASGVIHLIVESVPDLTADLKTVSGLDVPFPLVAGRGDEARHGGGGPDNREGKPPEPKPRDIYVPDMHIETLKLKARNFR